MADTLDLLTFEEAMEELSLNGNKVPSKADQIARWVTAVSRRFDAKAGPMVVRTITDELHDVDGLDVFDLNKRPVSSITSVTEYLSGTGTAVTAETVAASGGYLLDGYTLYRRSSWSGSTWSGQVLVTYVAGRYADTASVDATAKTAAGMALRRLQAREGAAWSRADPFGGEDQGAAGFFRIIDPLIEEWLDNYETTVGIA